MKKSLPGSILDREYNKFRPTPEGPAVATLESRVEADRLFHYGESGLTHPGAAYKILEFVVPNASHIDLTEVRVTCRIEGMIALKINNVTIDSGRTGAACPNFKSTYVARHYADPADIISIYFEARDGSPEAPIEAYLGGFIYGDMEE